MLVIDLALPSSDQSVLSVVKVEKGGDYWAL